MTFLSYLINGISLGSVYAIIALGYTMVYGIAKMLNFAHGDVIMIGGYISFIVTNNMGLPAIVSVLCAMFVCTLLGITIDQSDNCFSEQPFETAKPCNPQCCSDGATIAGDCLKL